MRSLFDSFLTCLQVKTANSMQLHTCAEERVGKQRPWTPCLMCSLGSVPNSSPGTAGLLTRPRVCSSALLIPRGLFTLQFDGIPLD